MTTVNIGYASWVWSVNSSLGVALPKTNMISLKITNIACFGAWGLMDPCYPKMFFPKVFETLSNEIPHVPKACLSPTTTKTRFWNMFEKGTSLFECVFVRLVWAPATSYTNLWDRTKMQTQTIHVSGMSLT